MNALVVFAAVLSVAYAQHWGGHPGVYANNPPGLPQDTPEVAAAKAAHLAALARVNQNNGGVWNNNNDDGQWHPDTSGNWNNGANWNDGSNWNGAANWQTYGHGGRWNGPLALPPGFDNNGAPLPVQDTPEVAAEKAKHFALYNGGPQHSAHNAGWNNNGAWNNNNGAWNNNNGAWNAGHGRWRRSAILAAAPLVHAPIVHAPLVSTHAIATPIVRTAIAAPVLSHSIIGAPVLRTHGLAHW